MDSIASQQRQRQMTETLISGQRSPSPYLVYMPGAEERDAIDKRLSKTHVPQTAGYIFLPSNEAQVWPPFLL